MLEQENARLFRRLETLAAELREAPAGSPAADVPELSRESQVRPMVQGAICGLLKPQLGPEAGASRGHEASIGVLIATREGAK